jgi:hypothetical protein
MEPMSGTVVHLGCCKKMVHIQCYTVKCPMCRAELPVPVHAVQPQHIVVPVPVMYEHQQNSAKARRILLGTLLITAIGAIFITSPYYT